jgi:S-adenosylmethionine hydrolase
LGAPITLLTDFGLADGYAGTMCGVILRINPAATIVDLTHQVPPQDVGYAAYVLATTYRYFPQGTVHVVVVDPGVGGERAGLATEAAGQYFVAPDNGVLSYVLAAGYAALIRLTEPRFWLPNPSRTFHGRDIFAPVAAHLSLGVPLQELGEPHAEPVRFPISEPVRRPDGTWVAHVIHVDRFGNVITDLRPDPDWLRQLASAEVSGRRVEAVVQTYSDVPSGAPAILVGSGGYLEIAVRDGDARAELDADVGSDVFLFPLI